jgi:hypothetical protein
MDRSDSAKRRSRTKDFQTLEREEIDANQPPATNPRQEELYEKVVDDPKPNKTVLEIPSGTGMVKTKIKTIEPKQEPIKSSESEVELKSFSDPEKKITSEELLYDTLMQDSETIPNLQESPEPNRPEKTSERENLLLDLLEMNIRYNP